MRVMVGPHLLERGEIVGRGRSPTRLGRLCKIQRERCDFTRLPQPSDRLPLHATLTAALF